MLVITGTQRSGTSLIATALEESGYGLSLTGMPWDEVGGYENKYICGFYNQYLGDPKFPFGTYAWPNVAPGQFAALGYKIAKFSFLLMNPAFVTIWHKFRPEGDTFLVMNRCKEHVVRSKQRMWEQFKHDSLLLQQSAGELQGNFLSSWSILDRNYEAIMLYFPECVSNLRAINHALAMLDPDVQIKSEVWERIYDPSKIHFR